MRNHWSLGKKNWKPERNTEKIGNQLNYFNIYGLQLNVRQYIIFALLKHFLTLIHCIWIYTTVHTMYVWKFWKFECQKFWKHFSDIWRPQKIPRWTHHPPTILRRYYFYTATWQISAQTTQLKLVAVKCGVGGGRLYGKRARRRQHRRCRI